MDLWQLDASLDAAEAAERDGSMAAALAAYGAALPLWRGEPFADQPYAAFADRERTRIRTRFSAAALRAGELLLAAGAPIDARHAASRAISADPFTEAAYRLLARAHVSEGDPLSAQQSVAACVAALAELGLHPGDETMALGRA